MSAANILRKKLQSLTTKETYDPRHQEGMIEHVLYRAEEFNAYDEYLNIIKNNPDKDFDGIVSIIYKDAEELEVID